VNDGGNGDSMRVIAFYLPQFHPIPENNAWWGPGFTEWTNVAKARPNFAGHRQPHLPGDLGFYDLRLPEAREAQAGLARDYGVHGFCYFWYWFNGKRLLHRPLDEVVATGRPNFPFCVCWANENWTRRWDGKDQDILVDQHYSLDDSAALIDALIPVFRDSRYIRVNTRPLFLVYRIDLIPDVGSHVSVWRDRCRDTGVGDPYLVAVQNARVKDPTPHGFDAVVEFPPVDCAAENLRPLFPLENPDFRGLVLRYASVAADYLRRDWTPYRQFRGVTPMWDNTARRQNDGGIVVESSPEIFGFWLERVLLQSRLRHRGDEQLVFVNAWNEWAEGNHLEPDRAHGRQYLVALREAIARAQAPFPERPSWPVMVEEARKAFDSATIARYERPDAPEVSVVMPVYNHARYLQRTLASIAVQEGIAFELIAIDDGSTDGSAGIVEAFASSAPCAVTLVRQSNAGAATALNRGMTLAAAPTIALINSDDLYAPGRLARMLRALDETGALFAMSDTEFIDDEDRVLDEHARRVAKLRAQIGRLRVEHLLRVIVQVNVAASTGNFLFRRSLIERIGGFAELPICHDWDFLLSATYATEVNFVDERLYRYRLHATNTQTTARLQGQFEGEITITRFVEHIREHPMLTDSSVREGYLEYLRSVGLGPRIPAASKPLAPL
jgi:glycosyltransferase involved in cell wall biosynthesis